MKYPIILRQTDPGFAVEVPDLPICITTGKTFEIALQNAKQVIDLHPEGLKEDGELIPQPSSKLEIRIDEPDDIITFVEVGEKRAA